MPTEPKAPSDLKVLLDSLVGYSKRVALEALAEEPHAPWAKPAGMEGSADAFGANAKALYDPLLKGAVDDSEAVKYKVSPTQLTLAGDAYYFIKSAKSAARLYNRSRVEDVAIGMSEKYAYEWGAFNYLYDIEKVDLSAKGVRKQ